MGTIIDKAQDENFFYLVSRKAARWNELRSSWQGKKIERVYLSPNLAGFSCHCPGYHVQCLEKSFFDLLDPTNLADQIDRIAYSVFIMNNNDIRLFRNPDHYARLYEASPTTIFVAWDWDNHHWLELSTFLAAFSDIYAPAHHENLYILSRFNWLLVGPVYCACVQWSRAFIEEHFPEIVSRSRSNDPLGKHIPYTTFRFRQQVLSSLSQYYPSIGFSDPSFHKRTELDRWQEWCGHKAHWIVPVLNDVPIRIFDALITGGIPIVPESLRFLPPLDALPEDFLVGYNPLDVLRPQEVVEKANRRFDLQGEEGIRARNRLAIEKHHGDVRIQQILDFVERALRTSP